MTTPLPDGHIENVCRIGQGDKCCAYLSAGVSWACAKEIPGVRAAIEERLELGTMGSKGDNCSGPPAFAERELDTTDVRVASILRDGFVEAHRADLPEEEDHDEDD